MVLSTLLALACPQQSYETLSREGNSGKESLGNLVRPQSWQVDEASWNVLSSLVSAALSSANLPHW